MPTIDFKHYGLLLAYAVLTGIINLVFSKRSQIDAWCESNPKLAALAKFCRGFGVDPWTILQSLVLLFTSKLPGYQKQSLADLEKPKPPSGMGPMGGMLALCLCLSMTGCNWLTHSVEPIAAECAPTPATLLTQVTQILLAGGDYTKELEQLAISDTERAVECAVESVIASLASKVGADSGAGPAVARGKAYLAAHKGAQ